VSHLMMDQLLEQFLQHFPTDFIPTDHYTCLCTVARQLPPFVGSGLECHLGETVPRFDYVVRAGHSDGGREILADQHPSFPSPQIDHPVWQRITTFSQAWLKSDLYTEIENLWLEFDLIPETPASVHVPAIFFDVDRQGLLDDAKRWQTITMALAHFSNNAIPKWLLDTVAQTLSCLPPHVRIYYVGLMLSRNTDALRLCLKGLHSTEIAPCLESIGWRGNNDELQKALHMAVDADQIILHLDVSRTLQDKVGLEIFFEGKQSRSHWAEFFNRLVQAELCSDAERQAILSWHGIDRIDPTQAPISQYISQATGKPLSRLGRRINHVKLVCNSGVSLRAKAYLYMFYM
jgi:hypothetical protein